MNTFDEHRISIKALHITLSNHHKNTSIECIEKTLEKVVHIRMKHFTAYIGNYGELALDSDNNMSNLQPTNINTITTQTHENVPKYVLPKSFASLESILEHWVSILL